MPERDWDLTFTFDEGGGFRVNPGEIGDDYIVIKALGDQVSLMGITRGKDTRFHHTEKLDRGEVMIVQFTENTSAMKIRGEAEIYHKYGMVKSEAPAKKL